MIISQDYCYIVLNSKMLCEYMYVTWCQKCMQFEPFKSKYWTCSLIYFSNLKGKRLKELMLTCQTLVMISWCNLDLFVLEFHFATRIEHKLIRTRKVKKNKKTNKGCMGNFSISITSLYHKHGLYSQQSALAMWHIIYYVSLP